VNQKDEFCLMSKVANRGLKVINSSNLEKIDLMMDLEYTNKVIPLDFAKFLEFSDGDFSHDICGILLNFNRETREMDNCFVPRCAIRESFGHGNE